MKRTLWDKVGDFVLGKGFYIVLFLCVATIGISGYYIIGAAGTPSPADLEPVTGNPTVVLPDQSAPAVREEKPSVPLPQSAKPAVPKVTGEDKKEEQQPDTSPAPEQALPPRPAAPAVYTWPVKGKSSGDSAWRPWLTTLPWGIGAPMGGSTFPPRRG